MKSRRQGFIEAVCGLRRVGVVGSSHIDVVAIVARASRILFLSISICTLCRPSGCEAQPATAAHAPTLIVQASHGNAVTALAWRPDGRVLATASYDHGVRLWDGRSGHLLAVLEGHSRAVTAVAWSPDGRLLVTASEDNTARLWDATNGQLQHTLQGHSAPLTAVAWSPDSQLVATASADRTVRVWDTANGRLRAVLSGHRDTVMSMAWSPHGRTLATASRDHSARLWDVSGSAFATSTSVSRAAPSLGPRCTLGHADEVVAVAWSADGRHVATASGDHTAKVWNAADGALQFTLTGHTQRVTAITWSPHGDTLATASEDASARLWDASNGRLLFTLQGHTAALQAVAWSPDGRTLATAGWDSTARLWDTASGHLRTILHLKGHGSVDVVAFSPDGQTLAGASVADAEGDEYFALWDVPSGRRRETLESHAAMVSWIGWNPDGTALSAVSDELTQWDANAGGLASGEHGDTFGSWATAASADGRFLATAADHRVSLWDRRTGHLRHMLDGNQRLVLSLAWSPQGHTVASAGMDGTVKLWDADSGRLRANLTGHMHWVMAAAWNPRGDVLASASRDRTVRLWDGHSGELLAIMHGHTRDVLAMAWSPDGRMLATAGMDGARLWDVATRSTRATLNVPTTHVQAIAWSPDGRTLAAVNRDTVALWDVASGRLRVSLVGHALSEGPHPQTPSPRGKGLPEGPHPQTPSPRGRGPTVTHLAWSPDSHTLATASTDNTARLWDTATGQLRATLRGHAGAVNALAWRPDGRILATGSDDCTIRFWSADGSALATAVELDHGKDWLVTTPQGFFDGSPGGWRKLLWRLGENIDDTAEPEQYFNDFYQPGLLTDVLNTARPLPDILKDRDDPRAGMNIADKDRRQPDVRIDRTDLPPSDRPYTQRTVGLTLQLRAAAPSGRYPSPGGIYDVRLFRNGTLVWRSPPGQPVAAGTLRVPDVPVLSGPNEFIAYAFNGDHVKSPDSAAVSLTGAGGLGRQPRAFVLSIGIDHYDVPRLDLDLAEADAIALRKRLGDGLAWLTTVSPIHPLLSAAATRDGILRALRRLQKEAQPEDTVIVSYSGHGWLSGGHFYLIPRDFDRSHRPDSALAHTISDLELERLFADMKAQNLCLILDACQSGGALEGEEWRQGPMNARGLFQLAYDKGMEIITACQSQQFAMEARVDAQGRPIEHGLLTFALLDGLQRAPRHDDRLEVTDWLSYAAEEVPRLLDAQERVGRGPVRLDANGRRTRHAQNPRVFQRRFGARAYPVAGSPGTGALTCPDDDGVETRDDRTSRSGGRWARADLPR